jgi:Baseplate J-like protein
VSIVLEDGLVYLCCEDRRRAELRDPSATLNGIDFLEVVDAGAPQADRQRMLRVNFVRTPPGVPVAKENVRITGGERIREIPVDDATFVDDVLVVRVATPGDFSTYTLRLLELDGTPLDGLDPLLSAVDFSFKVECPSDFDCRPFCSCPPAERDDPPIDYTVKDYESFRRLMLDRLALVAPEWTERNPADLGVALVELVAYVADYLSYEQDAVATEAYLGTARRRVSIRRHATLLDYPMHDGCNARVFVHLRAQGNAAVTLPVKSRLLTELPGRDAVLDTVAFEKALDERPEVFETMHDVTIRTEHDELALYAWGERECCVPEGATRATLAGRWPDLHKGDLVLFEEVTGPRTGADEDADPTRRHVVRLSVEPALLEDSLYPDPDDPGDATKHRPVTEIEWGVEDALPFAFCISGRTDAEHGRRYVDGITVARGNVVLADHGRTIPEEEQLGAPSTPRPGPRRDSCDRCGGVVMETVPARFAPELAGGPLTHAARVKRTAIVDGRRQRLFFDPDRSAAAAMTWELSRVLPVISLEDEDGRRWLPQRDLLSSDAFAPEFVAEVDDAGRATLRFGDGEHGARPAPGVALAATYRIANGARGNVGADSIRHIVLDDPGLADGVEAVRNPLSARGGTDPESLERVRVDAPAAFKTLERAVTPEDYATIAQRHAEVQRAQATLRWTGSWRTVYLTVDRLGGRAVDADFEAALRTHLEPYRMAGHDLEIDGPRFVALELELEICVQPGYFRGDVAGALLEVLGSRTLPDGRRGHFHPDNLTFGQAVLLSPIVAAAAAVPGVRDVQVLTFERLGVSSRTAIDEGSLAIGRLEIARLDNDPNFPERGILTLDLKGGR